MSIIMHQNMVERFATLYPKERLIYFEEALRISSFRKNIKE
jgi:chromosome segregation ATPase